MALLDYKIVNITRNKRHVEATIRVYRGRVTTEDEMQGTPPVPTPVTRYRRIAMIAERQLAYDVPRDMTQEEFIRKARAYINNKLLMYAQANGHTVITEQHDITDLEAVSNETGGI